MNRLIAAFVFSICFLVPAFSQAQSISYDKAVLKLVDNVKVASLDPGVVQALRVKPGDQIEKGQILVMLDSDIYESEANANRFSWLVAAQEAKNDVNLRFAEKSLALNEKQLEKSLAAVQQFSRSISETEIDRLKLERDQSALSIEQAMMEKETAELNVKLREEQKRAAEIRLQRRNILSPIRGTVAEVPIQQGESVTSGQPVVRIINLDRLRVIAPFDMDLALQINKDLDAYFEVMVAGKSKRYPANIVFVNPELEVTGKSVLVWIDIDNSSRELLPGLKGRVVIGL